MAKKDENKRRLAELMREAGLVTVCRTEGRTVPTYKHILWVYQKIQKIEAQLNRLSGRVGVPCDLDVGIKWFPDDGG